MPRSTLPAGRRRRRRCPHGNSGRPSAGASASPSTASLPCSTRRSKTGWLRANAASSMPTWRGARGEDGPMMMLEILERTPVWVYVLFVALLYLGAAPVRTRRIRLAPLLLLPAAMAAFSFYGFVASFGDRALAFAPWFVTAIATTLALVIGGYPKGATRAGGGYAVPRSRLPLAVILAIFFSRYAITVMLAIDPSIKENGSVQAIAGLLYGLSSGYFVGRALGMLRSGKRAAPRDEAPSTSGLP